MSKNKQLTGEQKLIRYYFFPLSLVTLAAFASVMAFGIETAKLVASLGTLAVSIGTLIYVSVFDSRSRWPEDNWRQRLVKVFSFTR